MNGTNYETIFIRFEENCIIRSSSLDLGVTFLPTDQVVRGSFPGSDMEFISSEELLHADEINAFSEGG